MAGKVLILLRKFELGSALGERLRAPGQRKVRTGLRGLRLVKLVPAMIAAAGFSAAPGAAAAVPAPLWHGVGHVVLSCEFDGLTDPAQSQALCRQILEQAKQLTRFPVSLATPADVTAQSGDLSRRSKQLLLKVKGQLIREGEGGSSLLVSIQPQRLGVSGPVRTVRQASVPLGWRNNEPQLREPILPLQLLLAEPRRRTGQPPFPLRSDER